MFITSTCPNIYYISIICFCEKLWLKRNWDTLNFVRPAMPLNTDYLHCGTANRRRLLFLMLPILCKISRCIIYEIIGYRNFVPQIVCKNCLEILGYVVDVGHDAQIHPSIYIGFAFKSTRTCSTQHHHRAVDNPPRVSLSSAKLECSKKGGYKKNGLRTESKTGAMTTS